MYFYILFITILLIIAFLSMSNKEGYFTYYAGMPGIPKTYISTHFVRGPPCHQ